VLLAEILALRHQFAILNPSAKKAPSPVTEILKYADLENNDFHP
jgi:hypothetical protein